MPRVLLFHGHDGHAVRAAFGRQVKVGDFRELLLQDRYKHFVERHTQNRWLIRWTAGVGAVIDRFDPMGDALDGKHREAVHFVVVTGVVAIRAFRGHLAGVDHAFEDDFGSGRHLQVIAAALHQFGAVAPQQAGKGVLGQAVGHRGNGAKNSRRVCAKGHGHREWLAGVFFAPVAVVQRTATVAQPAHDDLVAANHLLTIDTEILPVLVRAFGHGQAPGNQGRHVARPAMLHRQHGEVYVIPLNDHFLAHRVLDDFRRHGNDLAEDRQLGPRILQTFRRLGLLEERQQLADFPQLADRLGAHAHCHALWRAEQIAEHRNRVASRVFEQQSRAFGTQRAVADFSHLQDWRNGNLDAFQFSALL